MGKYNIIILITIAIFTFFSHLPPRWFQQPAEGVFGQIGVLAGEVHRALHLAQLHAWRYVTRKRGGAGLKVGTLTGQWFTACI